jgi:branched-chain amino acid transport system ATP-binding protein
VTATAPGLKVEDVSVRFAGLTALDGVSLTASPGQLLGVIGPNGAGKTTLFNVICGFVRPQNGTISWRGEALRRIKPHELVKRGIARTVQGVRLFPHLTVLENVMVGADHLHRPGLASAFLGLPRSDRSERALREAAGEALERLGVAGVADRLASTLPYPVQKRVSLARSLAAKPDLLLLDEPAGGLGADDVAELGELLRGLDKSMTVMLVEHRMDLVMSVCDHVTVLDSGRVIAGGPPQQVQSDERVLEAYLGSEERGSA